MNLKPCPTCNSTARLHSQQVAEDAVACWAECDRCDAKTEEVEDAYADWATAASLWEAGALA